MKNIIKLCILSLLTTLSSCEDFLDRAPLDEVSEADFYRTPTELRSAVNAFYNDLPGWAATSVGFNVLPDSGTDMGIGLEPSNRISGLDYNIPTSSTNAIWSWNEVREANWYLDHVDQAEGDETEINQYIGEGYFFRAYYYFDLLIRYGDLPIFDEYFDNTDEQFVFAARDPRNEVVDFMLSDLDTAISLLQSFPDISEHPRISREAAQLFKARVALYEGTWEKYHSGTDFEASGSDGSSFIQIAADAAESVIDSGIFTLHSDYGSLFNQIGLSGNSEVMLWRDYDDFGLGISNALQTSWPNRCGYTRFAMRSFLCTDGQPISVSPLFNDGDDEDLSTIENNRDPRLSAALMVPGDLTRIDTDASQTTWTHPDFTTANAGLTGYESQKYREVNIDANINNFSRSTSRILMRYAEALLIFAEAKAELGSIAQSDLDKSINLLRSRANMPDITLNSITTDPDWPNYGYSLTDILYEIRRERSVELIAEGFRANDIYRWRAHSLFDGSLPRGAFYNDGIVDTETNISAIDSDGYLNPFDGFGNYNFDESRAYLNALPLDELQLNTNLTQNPGW